MASPPIFFTERRLGIGQKDNSETIEHRLRISEKITFNKYSEAQVRSGAKFSTGHISPIGLPNAYPLMILGNAKIWI